MKKKILTGFALGAVALTGVMGLAGCGEEDPFADANVISSNMLTSLAADITSDETNETDIYKGFRLKFQQSGEDLESLYCGLEERIIHNATIEYVEGEEGFVLKASIEFDKRFGEGRETTEFYAQDGKLYEKTGSFIAPAATDIYALSDFDDGSGLMLKAYSILPTFMIDLNAETGANKYESSHVSDSNHDYWDHYRYSTTTEGEKITAEIHYLNDVIYKMATTERNGESKLTIETLKETPTAPSWVNA